MDEILQELAETVQSNGVNIVVVGHDGVGKSVWMYDAAAYIFELADGWTNPKGTQRASRTRSENLKSQLAKFALLAKSKTSKEPTMFQDTIGTCRLTLVDIPGSSFTTQGDTPLQEKRIRASVQCALLCHAVVIVSSLNPDNGPTSILTEFLRQIKETAAGGHVPVAWHVFSHADEVVEEYDPRFAFDITTFADVARLGTQNAWSFYGTPPMDVGFSKWLKARAIRMSNTEQLDKPRDDGRVALSDALLRWLSNPENARGAPMKDLIDRWSGGIGLTISGDATTKGNYRIITGCQGPVDYCRLRFHGSALIAPEKIKQRAQRAETILRRLLNWLGGGPYEK